MWAHGNSISDILVGSQPWDWDFLFTHAIEHCENKPFRLFNKPLAIVRTGDANRFLYLVWTNIPSVYDIKQWKWEWNFHLSIYLHFD